jgi:hypothetical protein
MVLDEAQYRLKIKAEIASVKRFAGYQDIKKQGQKTSAKQEHWHAF